MPLILNGDGSVGPLSATEVGYLDGVTSPVQTQIDNKVPSNDSAEVLTSQTTTTTTYTDLATVGPSVTLTTGTKALVTISLWIANNTAGQASLASFAVSGATTLSPATERAVVVYGEGGNLRMSYSYILKNLTAGSNTFTMKYRVSGGTGTFETRQISVINMGS